ncbi:hypothetical protein KC865_03460 [Candidatus Kaiserbacteria bacterium]|nr:hypothetical protein [Candidatus Kaiserbacteria bacterium]USN92515.1 MAG: hypothetical protein H6782_01720 [Candidatus Nomurabacteria bacterium]
MKGHNGRDSGGCFILLDSNNSVIGISYQSYKSHEKEDMFCLSFPVAFTARQACIIFRQDSLIFCDRHGNKATFAGSRDLILDLAKLYMDQRSSLRAFLIREPRRFEIRLPESEIQKLAPLKPVATKKKTATFLVAFTSAKSERIIL